MLQGSAVFSQILRLCNRRRYRHINRAQVVIYILQHLSIVNAWRDCVCAKVIWKFSQYFCLQSQWLYRAVSVSSAKIFMFYKFVFTSLYTEQVGSSNLYVGSVGFESWLEHGQLLLRFLYFSHFLQTSAGVVPQIRPWLLPTIFLPIHYSPVILSFNAV